MMQNQPWTGSNPALRENRLPEQRNAPYFLLHSAMQWEFIEDSLEWLPTFSELREEAGVNGVQQTANGPDTTLARVHAADQGFTVLDYRQHEYMSRYPTANGGFFYCSRWSTPKVIGRNVIWSQDRAGYNDWRRSLIEQGYIEQIDPDVCRLIMDRWQRRIRRYIRDQHIPEFKEKMNDLAATLERMERATVKLTEPAEPVKPAPKRRTRKKAAQ